MWIKKWIKKLWYFFVCERTINYCQYNNIYYKHAESYIKDDFAQAYPEAMKMLSSEFINQVGTKELQRLLIRIQYHRKIEK